MTEGRQKSRSTDKNSIDTRTNKQKTGQVPELRAKDPTAPFAETTLLITGELSTVGAITLATHCFD
jgi:hypothetical protein